MLPHPPPQQKGKRSLVEFWGEYEFTLDDRGRVSIPASFRRDFGTTAYLTMGQDGCIEVYTEAGFRDMAKQVAVQTRTTPEGRQSRRDFYGQTFQAELDRQGRVLIPASLREKAAVEGPVVIVGSMECLEIWNPKQLRSLSEARATSSPGQAYRE